MEKIDPYKHKERFDKWNKEKEIKGINSVNKKILLNFINDMALGVNISKGSKKGARSFIRLNTIRQRLVFIIKEFEKRKVKDIRKVTANQLHSLFEDMRAGVLKTRTGTPYKSVGDYIKVFKSFYHWYQKTSKEKIEDITGDLDTRGEKPKFVYFNEKDFNNILKEAPIDLKPILALCWDSGMRVTELMNVQVGDFSKEFKELNIKEESSKTFGRKIKLMICPTQIKKYVEFMELSSEDLICKIHPQVINQLLRAIGKKVLTKEQIKFKNLSLYDIRHSSACFWLPRYKSESALKYRFGWKKSDMIHYYTEFLGMKDTITKDDLYLDITKQELEKRIDKVEGENKEFLDKVKILESSLSNFAGGFIQMINKFPEYKKIEVTKKLLNEFETYKKSKKS